MKKSFQFVFGLVILATLNFAISGAQTATKANQATAQAANAASSVPPTASAAVPALSTLTDSTFIIGSDDVLAISVWKEPDLTKLIPVRTDGKISLPLIGEIQASGRTPSQLQKDITFSLRSYITDPQVSVIVQEIRSLKFNILGQVAKPGSYSLNTGMTVVDAIALAGGFRDFAKKKGIYVLRHDAGGIEIKVPFNYQEFIKGKNTDSNIALRSRDTVVVP